MCNVAALCFGLIFCFEIEGSAALPNRLSKARPPALTVTELKPVSKSLPALNQNAQCYYPKWWRRFSLESLDPNHPFLQLINFYKILHNSTVVIHPYSSELYSKVTVLESSLTFSCWTRELPRQDAK
jgi:hypothetical protein